MTATCAATDGEEETMTSEIEVELTVEHADFVMSNHRVHDVSVLPGVAFLDVAARALLATGTDRATLEFHDVFFIQPVTTAPGNDRRVRLTVDGPPTGRRTLRVVSRPATDPATGWVENLTATLVPAGPGPDPAAGWRERADALERTEPDGSMADLYAQARGEGIVHGPAMSCHGSLHRRDGALLARLTLDPAAPQAGFHLHPAMLDAATVAAFGQLPSPGDPFIPLHIGRVRVHRPLPVSCRVLVPEPERMAPSGDLLTSSLVVLDDTGEPLVEIDGLRCKRIRHAGLLARPGAPEAAEPAAPAAESVEPAAPAPASAASEPALPAAGSAAGAAETTGRDRVERCLRAVVARRLGVAPSAVDAERGFYDQGLDSVALLAIGRELEEWLGRTIYPTLLFEYPDIARLAVHLAADGPIPDGPVPDLDGPAAEADGDTAADADGAASPPAAEARTVCYRPHWVPDAAAEPDPFTPLVVDLAGAGREEAVTRRLGGEAPVARPVADVTDRASWRTGLEPLSGPVLIVLLAGDGIDPGHVHAVWAAAAAAAVDRHLRARIVVLHPGTDSTDAACGALAAAMRTAAVELPTLTGRVVAVPPGILADPAATAAAARAEAGGPEPVAEVRIGADGRRRVRRLRRWTPEPEQPGTVLRPGVRCVVTGAAGGLGRLLTGWLTGQKRARVVMLGRGEPDGDLAADLAAWTAAGHDVRYRRADVTEPAELSVALDRARADLGGLDLVFHCAGTLRDATVPRQRPEDATAVLAPKIVGTDTLRRLTAADDLHRLVLFSSLSAQAPNPGQSTYAYANSVLDHVAEQDAAVGVRTLSVGWPYWAEGGMRAGADEPGMPTTTGLDLLERLLDAGVTGAVTVGHGDGDDLDAVLEPVEAVAEPVAGPTLLRRAEPQEPTPIAVVGLAGRYPGAGSPAEFWARLRAGEDCVGTIPDDRCPPGTDPLVGGFLDRIGGFDAAFFGISRREAELMDPQERLFLATCWHALEDAGLPAGALTDTAIGVFVGVMWNQYQLLDPAGDGVRAMAMHSAIANRVSYLLNLRGPSMAVDTACSSSLSAVHLAVQSIRRGECRAALAGGVNLTTHPDKYRQLTHGGFLSPDGRCRAFGAGAAGYVPGEGVGAVLLKPLPDALADGHHIYALIVGSYLNHNGRSGGFTVPTPAGQAEVIRAALADAGIDPGTVGYVEAHGTGTALGDPIEIDGLSAALGPADADRHVGSVKSNIGHLEGAAGIASLTKVLLQLRHRTIVPSLHAEPPNPQLRLAEAGLRVPSAVTPWQPVGDAPLRAGISGFGAGGSNAHLVVQEAPAGPPAAERPGPHLFVLSARTATALRAYAGRLRDALTADPDPTAGDGVEQRVLDTVAEVLCVPTTALDPAETLEDVGLDPVGLEQVRERLHVDGIELGTVEPDTRIGDLVAGVGPDRRAGASSGDAAGPGGPATLADVAYTLQVGRWQLPHRLAVVADDRAGLLRALDAVARGETTGPEVCRTGDERPVDRPDGDLAELFRAGHLDDVAARWVAGEDVDWAACHAHVDRARRVPLPGYPFEEKHYWNGDWQAGRVDTRVSAPVAEQSSRAAEAPVAVAEQPAPPAGEVAGRPATEAEIAELVGTFLGDELFLTGEEIDIEASFQDLGLDSITGELLRGKLEETLGVELTSVEFYDHPSVLRLARHLAGKDARLPGGAQPPSAADQPPAVPSPADEPEPQWYAPDDVAVIGYSVTAPDAPDAETFWANIRAGRCSIGPVPTERLDLAARYSPQRPVPGRTYTTAGAMLDRVDLFDAGFFAVSPVEAESMDPQQRLFLQESWRALEHAGHAGMGGEPRRYGVFVGTGTGDYARLLGEQDVADTAQAFLGVSPSILAARIAYHLDLVGPTMAVDTACSSSLVAIHLAAESLRRGECDAALAGGVALMLTPQLHVRSSQIGMLSPSGRCRPFDEEADGTVLGEAVGVVLLKRLDRALADGDRVHAVIRAGGVNGDGRTNGITAPSAASQQRLLADVHDRAGIRPGEIGYVEAHGTGTPLGDPIEFAALAAVIGRDAPAGYRCAVGSIKGNVGHTTMAAGVLGLLKSVLALKHGEIPPSAGFERPNPRIDLAATPFELPDQARPWPAPATGGPRTAVVSSFGFSGTNCHLVVGEAPVQEPLPPATEDVVVPVSARTPDELADAITDLAGALRPDMSAADVAFTLSTGRRHHPVRAAFRVRTTAELVAALRSWTPPAAPAAGADTSGPDQRYLAGEDVDWVALWRDRPARRTPLPATRFRAERHWLTPRPEPALPDSATGDAAALPADEPLLDSAEPVRVFVPDTRPASPPSTPEPAGTVAVLASPGAPNLADHLARWHEDAGSRVVRAPLGAPVPAGADRVYLLAGPGDDDLVVVPVAETVRSLVDRSPADQAPRLAVVLDTTRHAAVVGLIRALRAERPGWRVGVLDVAGADPAGVADLAGRLAVEPLTDAVVRVSGVERRLPVLREVTVEVAPVVRDGDHVLVVGGAGGIGSALSRRLAAGGARLTWVGRRPLDDAIRARMVEIDGNVDYLSADVTDETALRAAVRTAARRSGRVTGAVLAAGDLVDRPLAQWSPDELGEQVTARVAAVRTFLAVLGETPPGFAVICSSAVAHLDSAGQAGYAAAVCAAAQAARRSPVTFPVHVVDWGWWGERGMAAGPSHRAAMQRAGVRSIGADEGAAALAAVVAAGVPWAVALKAEPHWYRRAGVETPEPAPVVPVAAASVPQPQAVREYVRETIAEVLHYAPDQVAENVTFDNFGVDSVLSLDVVARFERDLGPLPSTLLFEHTTVARLAEHLRAEYGDRLPRRQPAVPLPAAPATSAPAEPVPALAAVGGAEPAGPGDATGPLAADDDIAVIGVAGRFPGAPDLDAFWDLLAEGRSGVTEIPPDRWDWRAHFDPEPGRPQRTYSRWGGFLTDVDRFDAAYFGILPSVAKDMDPQERLFLETSWQLLGRAGYLGEHVREPETGVFVGVMYGTYGELGATQWAAGRLSGAHTAYWSIANRVSHQFDLQGPSYAVDSACSSSLTALHLACESLRRGECRMAVAGGVNLILHPSHHVSLSALTMLSPQGACKAFDASADGYVPGEGVAAVLLKPLAQAVADGDDIWAVIKGSALTAGGRTSGFTVPNPQAQGRAIARALRRSGVDPASIGYLEAHGTGTELGDPIEVAGMIDAFRPASGAPPALMGSVKSNIGHLESAAGIAALVKVLLQLRYRQIVPTVGLTEVNPKIDLSRAPFHPAKDRTPWPAPSDGGPRRAGISSFGAGGANAHLVVQEYQHAGHGEPDPTGPQLVLLSARDEEALRDTAARWAAFARQPRHADGCPAGLASIAWTSQLGRPAEPVRLAVIARDLDDLADQLDQFAASGATGPRRVLGRGEGDSLLNSATGVQLVDAALRGRDLAALAAAWTGGAEVDWRKAWPAGHPPRVTLPVNRLHGRRFWLDLIAPTEPGPHPGAASSQPVTGSETAVGRSGGTTPPASGPAPTAGAALDLAALGPVADEHHVGGRRWLPGAAVPALAAAGGESLRDLRWLAPVELDGGVRPGWRTLDDGTVAVTHGDRCLVTFRREPAAAPAGPVRAPELGPDARTVAGADLYARLRAAGLRHGPALRCLCKVRAAGDTAVADLDASALRGPARVAALLDAAFCAAAVLIDRPGTWVPVSADRIDLDPRLPGHCQAVVRRRDDRGGTTFDIALVDRQPGDAAVVARVDAFRVAAVPAGPVEQDGASRVAGPVQVSVAAWEPEPRPEPGRTLRRLLVVGADPDLCAGLTDAFGPDVRVAHTPATASIDDRAATLAVLTGSFDGELPDALLVASAAHPDALTALLGYSAAVLDRRGRPALRVAVAGDLTDPTVAGLAGAVRTLVLEHTGATAVAVDVDLADPRAARLLHAEMLAGGDEPVQVRYADGQRLVRRLRAVELPDTCPLSLRPDAAYLVTGGAGALGTASARALLEAGAGTVILAGRSDLDPVRERAVRGLGGRARYLRADVSDPRQVRPLIERIVADHGPLAGIVHAAGVLRDRRLVAKTGADVAAVLAPKVTAVHLLDEATHDQPLDFLALYSSVTAEVGNPGQVDYAYANAYLDAFAARREALRRAGRRRGRTLSLGWSFWREGGMGVAEGTGAAVARRGGGRPLETDDALAVLRRALACDHAHLVVTGEDVDRPAPAAAEPPASQAAESPAPADVRDEVRRIAAGFLLVDPADVDVTAELMDLGFDSITLTQLVNEVNDRYGLDLLPTVLFECPTLAGFTDYLVEHHGAALGGPAAPAQPEPVLAALPAAPSGFAGTEPIAIVGMAALLPGADDPDEFWQLLLSGREAVGPVPEDRHDLRGDGRLAGLRGGFLPDVAVFDHRLFGVAPREAALMDPQQRLFLQAVWRCVENSGRRPSSLAGSRTGVFVGVATTDYQTLMTRHGVATEGHTATGVAHAVLANRVSHLFDLCGPSEAVDTACSSSLVAMHRAVTAIRAGECDAALVGGVNVLLDPEVFIAFQGAGMLSPDGRCKTFDASADGYVRGEGVGAFLLRPLSAALADGDPVHAVVLGSAVNHTGRTASLTAPEPAAQAEVVRDALRRAGADPATIGYVETHGTGTRLGDPVEIEGLKKVFAGALDEQDDPILLGSVKTNVGHLEAAAGVAGLVKAVLALRHGVVPPTRNLTEVNPLLRLSGTGLRLAREATPWPARPAVEPQRRAGISSFGFGGSNAHVVLATPPARAPHRPATGPYAFPLSAPDEKRLGEYAGRLADALDRLGDDDAASVAWTLQTGREEFAHRAAVVADSLSVAVAALRALAGGGDHSPVPVHRGTDAGTPTVPPAGASADDLAAAWVTGARVEWPGGSAPRVSLPGVPFARTRFWFDAPARPAIPHPSTTPPDPETAEVPMQPADDPVVSAPVARPRVRLAPLTATASQPSAPAPAPALDLAPTATRDAALDSAPATASRRVPPPAPVSASTAPAAEPAPVSASTVSVSPNAGPGAAAVAALLRTELAHILAVDEDELAGDRPLTEYGVDSVFRMELARSAGERLHTALTAEDMYAADTLDGLAATVAAKVTATPAAATAVPDAAPAVASNVPAPAAPVTRGTGPAGGDLGEQVRHFLTHALGRQIDPARSFVDNALTSMDMIRAISALERHLGRGLSKTALFDHPSIADLTDWLVEQRGAAAVAALGAAEPDSGPTGPGLPPPSDPHGDGGQLVVDRRAVASQPELAALVGDLEERYGREIGLAGRDIAPMLFIDSGRRGMLAFGRRGDDMVSWSYVGPDDCFADICAEFVAYARSGGWRPNILSLQELDQAGPYRMTATPFGAMQRIDDLSQFSLHGKAMARLRSMVHRFGRQPDAHTVEYASGSDPAIDRAIGEVIDRWTETKNWVNPYVRTVRDEIVRGALGPRQRIFLSYLRGQLSHVVIIAKMPSVDGYLLDLEFYPAELPAGGLEHAIVTILETLRAEGRTCFSFGASFGVSLGRAVRPAPEVAQGLAEMRAGGLLSEGNFRFKNKFRPTNLPLYLCQLADAERTPAEDVVLMIADPAPVPVVTAAAVQSVSVQSVSVPAAEPAPADPATAAARRAVLAEAGWNPLRLPHDRVPFDLITDSWMERSDEWVQHRIDELIRQSAGTRDADRIAPPWLPHRHVLALPSGRAAEAALTRCWPGPRGTVLHDRCFPTWLFALATEGFTPVVVGSPAGGDVDLERLRRLLAEHPGEVSFVVLEPGRNSAGGRPMSPSNLRAACDLIHRAGSRVVLDATRVVANALACGGAPDPWELVTEQLRCADAVTLSASKEFGVDGGGLLATDDDALARELRAQIGLGFRDVGLIARRRLAAALADTGWVTAALRRRRAAHDALRTGLVRAGVPVDAEGTGHCVLLNVPALTAGREMAEPVAAVAAHLFVAAGVRVGPHLDGGDPDLAGRLRLAVPVGLPPETAAVVADRIAGALREVAAIPDLTRTDRDTAVELACYRPSESVPADVRAELAGGYAPADENWQVLRAAVPGVRRHLLDVTGGRAEVFEAGTGRPVLFLTPFNIGAGCYAGQVAAVARERRAVVVHHPGVGRTALDRPVTLAGITRLYTEVLAVLGITEPVHVVGASFGSLLAQNLVLDEPARAASLTLICGSYRYANRNGAVNRLDEVLAVDFDSVERGGGRLDRAGATELLMRCQSMDARTGLQYLDVFAAEPDLRDRLEEIQVPTLLVTGRHDSVIPQRTSHLLHGLIPQSSYREIPDAGHFPTVTHADTVAGLLTGFLDECERQPSAATSGRPA
ncbi:SDR family NAD(P)-dependent oxidoreductase [Micromonospora haikouensis]|uniref:SDR family NAD(P)-dependent oxidoreductase n=1 Tax=Micromonospora haikouensis TaxID=686309 RepID=UPI003D9384EF